MENVQIELKMSCLLNIFLKCNIIIIIFCTELYRSERMQSIGSDRSLAVGPQRDLYMGTRSHELAVGRSGSQG